MIRALVAVVVWTVVVVWGSEPARAYFANGATIVSASLARLEEGDDNTQTVVVSADGRYAVFQTRSRNFFADDDPDPPGAFRSGGLFRRDLVTGDLAPVADGDLRTDADPDATVLRGAQNPSVSADGRYVVFATGRQLVASDANTNVDVYLRDMDVAIGQPGAYELISARDGSLAGTSYGPADPDRPGLNPGADVAPRGAVSGDGRYVVFKTTAVSDLPASPTVDVAPLQLFLRDRVTHTTRVITSDQLTGEPVGGAIGAASISADGTTVLWVGRNAPAQTRFLDGEGQNSSLEYYLWRRVADGPAAATRRITGLSDPDDPACASPLVENPNALGPCYGPLAQAEGYVGGIVNAAPSMSADGYEVAFTTIAFRRAEQSPAISSDVFLTDMHPGVSRKAGTVELTRDATGDQSVTAAIDGLAISADGRWLLLATVRTQFPFAALTPVSPVRSRADTRELYLADLATAGRPVERVLHGYRGTDSDGAVTALPAMSADGRRVVFVSAATNLFFGDANNRSDAFAVDRADGPPPEAPPPDPAPLEAPSLPLPDGTSTSPRVAKLNAFLRKARSGTAVVVVKAPDAGELVAVARGRVPRADGKLAGKAQVVGRTKATVKKRRQVTLTIRLTAAVARRLAPRAELRAQVEVTFTDLAGDDARKRLTAVFVGATPRPKAKRKASHS